MKEKQLREKILEGLKLTSQQLLKTKKDRNFDLIISKDNKIIRIKPSEIKTN